MFLSLINNGNPIEKEITTIPYDNEAAQKGWI